MLVTHLPFSWSSTLVRGAANPESALPQIVTQVSDFGHFGVGLFLVISGFCIHLRWARRPDTRDFVTFWRRRLTRLYPPYVAALLASLAGLFVVFGLLAHGTGAGAFGYGAFSDMAGDVASLLLLVQNTNNASQAVGNGPFWTIALEEQLYILYFVLLIVRPRLGWTWTLGAVTAISLAWRTAPLLTPTPFGDHWVGLGPSRWIEWTLGALAVEAYFGLVRLPQWCRSARVAAATTIVAVFVNLSPQDPPARVFGDAVFGLAFFLWVNVAVRLERSGVLGRIASARALAGVGLFSYSLYLTQEPVIVATKQLLLRLGLTPGTWQGAAIIVGRFAVAIVVAYIFYRVVERQFIELSRRVKEPIRPTSTPVEKPSA